MQSSLQPISFNPRGAFWPPHLPKPLARPCPLRFVISHSTSELGQVLRIHPRSLPQFLFTRSLSQWGEGRALAFCTPSSQCAPEPLPNLVRLSSAEQLPTSFLLATPNFKPHLGVPLRETKLWAILSARPIPLQTEGRAPPPSLLPAARSQAPAPAPLPSPSRQLASCTPRPSPSSFAIVSAEARVARRLPSGPESPKPPRLSSRGRPGPLPAAAPPLPDPPPSGVAANCVPQTRREPECRERRPAGAFRQRAWGRAHRGPVFAILHGGARLVLLRLPSLLRVTLTRNQEPERAFRDVGLDRKSHPVPITVPFYKQKTEQVFLLKRRASHC